MSSLSSWAFKSNNVRLGSSYSKVSTLMLLLPNLDSIKQKKCIPAILRLKLVKDDSGEKVDESLYKSIIGSLLYLTVSRLDIAFAVGIYARYQASLRVSYLHSAKHILKYVLGTMGCGIRMILHKYLWVIVMLTVQDALMIGRVP